MTARKASRGRGPASTTLAPTPPVIRPAKIRDRHCERLALVYVRQSTPQQVKENRESRERQYALADHAARLGWPAERVLVIDEDQGRSGRTAAARSGFQRLLAEVAMGHVGIVLGLEMSRLSRSSADWHRLLELCAVFGSLLGDQDGVYDPTDPNDRLLLGLKGTLSEAEQFTLKNRLERGRQNKAARGELFYGLPIGYVFDPTGAVILDPDEQVRFVVQLVFDKFDELGSARSVCAYLRHNGILLGTRPGRGPQRGQLLWVKATPAAVLRLLHHPIYTGAYSHGRQQIVRGRTAPSGRPSTRQVPTADIPVLLRERLPAYITWERYQANCARLQQNCLGPTTPGTPRGGAALLGGLVVCATCGCRFSPRSRKGTSRPYYTCERHSRHCLPPTTCHGIRAAVVDDVVVAQLLRALEPAGLELSLQAADACVREREQLDRHWQQQRTRARYEAERAERQYQAVEPANRLVARTLEQRWEEALRQARQLDEDYERFVRTQPPHLTAAERERIRSLAVDIPALWRAAETTNVERKDLIRCLVERVVVQVALQGEEVGVTIHWNGGHVTRHQTVRGLGTYEQMATYPELIAALRRWHAVGSTPTEIAEKLNAAGYRTPRRQRPFTRAQVHGLLRRVGLSGGRRQPEDLAADEWWLCDLAAHLHVGAATVRRWVARRWVQARRSRDRQHWILWADRQDLERLRALATLVQVGANEYPHELTTAPTV
jgi:DNA invertase Pin-like site-specific DNA recombinase